MDFQQAENRLKQLKTQFEAGTLTEADLKTKLENLMIRDEQGHWWMIGYETERWYRHDGTNWVQTNLPGSPLQQKSIPMPHWIAILWITLGWAIGWTSAWPIGGLIAGLIIAITLRTERVLSDWKSMLWITLAWAIAGAIAWPISWQIPGGFGYIIGWAIGWAIGGLVNAITLRTERVLSDWNNILWITLGWAIGGAVGAIGGAIDWAVGGAIGGAIGGFVMIWQLRSEKNKRQVN
jgi:hypothetical protein